MAKTLIAYFSRADENYFGGAMRYVKVGNTEIVCNLMKELMSWMPMPDRSWRANCRTWTTMTSS